jgi:hypothetical protein
VQIAALAGAIVVEMGLIALVVTRLRDRDPRPLALAILFVVGLHFLIMGLAHGPLIARSSGVEAVALAAGAGLR